MAAKNTLFSPERAGAADALAEDLEAAGPVSQVRPSRADGVDGIREDVALVRAACARDPRAQSRIFRKYAPLVKAKLRSSIGARDLEDMVQEVFLRLFNCLP